MSLRSVDVQIRVKVQVVGRFSMPGVRLENGLSMWSLRKKVTGIRISQRKIQTSRMRTIKGRVKSKMECKLRLSCYAR